MHVMPETMEQRLLEPLNALETSLNSLIHSLTTTTTFTSAPAASQALVDADNSLTSALTTLKQHQENYSRILQLRAEKQSLQDKLKSTVFECARFKRDLHDIDARIVDTSDSEDDDDDDETSGKYNRVDYEMLLAFASRIGKHNAIAQQEAERQADEEEEREGRRRREDDNSAVGASLSQSTMVNGSHAENNNNSFADHSMTTAQSSQTQTHEVQEMMAVAKDKQSWDRSITTAPFPNALFLRMGALGNLQRMREDDGEEAVEAYIEKMVRETELGGKPG